jgi:hypothetical protein
MELNIPWVHSPFFEQELKEKRLSPEMEDYARHYHTQGFVHLKGVIDSELIDAVVHEVDTKHGATYSFEEPKMLDLWEKSKLVAKLAVDPQIMELLEVLYDRKPIPFQTLNLKYGSQQRAHSDTIHFNSLPRGYMCGAWVALEDVDEENGTLVYYPKSQHLPEYDYSTFHKHFKSNEGLSHREDYHAYYEPFVEQLMQNAGLEPHYLKAKKGDVLIWSANFVHGGMPVKDTNRTRWSQVTHYFFEDCLYTSPMLSNPVAGEWFLKKITNIQTGEKTWGTYNGDEVRQKNIGAQRYLISPSAGFNKRDFDHMVGRIYRFFGGKG